jgi:hypothetical protein
MSYVPKHSDGLLVVALSDNGVKSCKRDGRKLFVDTFIAHVT